MRILAIEDDLNLRDVLRHGLSTNGFSVDSFGTAAEAEEAAQANHYDAIVLDRMLPDKDGLELCRAMRQRGVKTSILILSGLSTVEDRVLGLNAGADDYIVKPFAFEELLARIGALLRRKDSESESKLAYADVEVDLLKRAVSRAGEPIQLRNKEYELLEFFMRRHDRVLPRTTIAEHVWDINYEFTSNVIDVYVSSLRRKLDKSSGKPLIHTVPGVGYMFSSVEIAA